MILTTLEARKYKLVSFIIQLKDEPLLADMENYLAEHVSEKDMPDVYMKAAKPLRRGATLAQLAAEANYKPIDREAFFKKVDALNIEEPIEDLLAMLTP